MLSKQLCTVLIATGTIIQSALGAGPSGASPYFSTRPQGVNAVRDLIGWQELINQSDRDCWYGAFAFTAEYTQSFRPNAISTSLFGTDAQCASKCSSFIAISGSRAETRGSSDWLGDYFGLPTDFQGTLNIQPMIRNVIGDFALYFGLDSWVERLYLRVDIPLVHTRWSMNYCEKVAVSGSNSYSPGYFTSDNSGNPSSDLLAKASDFFTGCAAPTLINEDGSSVIFDKLNAAKWAGNGCNCGTLTATRLADIALEVGYNFIAYEDYHFGILLRTLAPTGNRPCGLYTFEPIVGNGGSWELGGGITSHIMLWNDPYCGATLQLYIDANVTHLFNAEQCRVFDLCGKPNSRYMLALKVAPQSNGLNGNTVPGDSSSVNVVTASDYQFDNHFSPVANLTRRKAKVSVGVQGDVVAKFAYNNGRGFSWDLGYNFWGRSCEKICLASCASNDPLNGTTWALKGDAQVYGFTSPGTLTGEFALAPSESRSDIHNGTNVFGPGDDETTNNASAITNPNIDNPQYASTGSTIVYATPTSNLLTNQANTSIQPVLLSINNLDVSGTKGLSQKVFTHFNYAWLEHDKYTPFVGVGGSAEFGKSGDCNAQCIAAPVSEENCNCCNSCNLSALSQWGIWIKGGFGF